MYGAKALIAMLEKSVEFELIMVPFNDDDRYDPKHMDVLRVNPKRQVPVLLHGGLELYDSTLIFEYLEDRYPDPPLWPPDPGARARARLLELESDEVYFPYVIRLMHLQYDLESEEAMVVRDAAARYYQRMEDLLKAGDYLAGSYSFADIAFYMAALFGERMGATVTSHTPKLIQWRDRMSSREAVKKAVKPLVNHLKAAGRPVPGFLMNSV
jgi:glutathione S-transferase